MNWTAAIDLNRDALLRILAVLTAWVGLVDGVGPARLQNGLYRKILSVLGPAESALRRLIVVAAREVRLRRKLGLSASPPDGSTFPRAAGPQNGTPKIPCFPLFDRRVRVAPTSPPVTSAPNIRFLDEPWDAAPAGPEIDLSKSLSRRIAQFERALNDLGREARRLVRWRTRQTGYAKPPMRPGRPPGYRRRAVHAVDTLLRDLHELALWVQAPPGTPMVRD